MNQALVDVRNIKYNVTKEALARIKCKQTIEDAHAHIVWWDGLCPPDRFCQLHPFQRINKIPNMDVICYKSTTFQALATMKSLYPSLFTFYPTTYQLPYQFGDFQREHIRTAAKSGQTVTWIIKPKAGCSGNGIRLIQNSYDAADMSQPAIIQRYVSPYLVSGHKFDFRLYVFIATIEPFTVYIYNDGLARFCSMHYEPPTRSNLSQKHSHITNTAVNADQSRESDVQILQLTSDVIRQIRVNDPNKGSTLWKRIRNVVSLTILAIYPQILKQIGAHAKSSKVAKSDNSIDPLHKYFHLLGIDIMLNEKMDPIVLELNDRPSIIASFPLEKQFKPKMLFEMMQMVTLDGAPPNEPSGGWEQIIPLPETEPNAQQIMSILLKQRAYNLPRLVVKQFSQKKQEGRLNCRQSLPPLHSMQ